MTDTTSAIADTDAARSPSAEWTTLTPDGRKARYGVAYIRSVCAQVGVNLQEMSPDEDVLAVDCDVKFPRGNVSVQVKCTSGLAIHGRSASWPVKGEWVRKWQQHLIPVYFVLVIVPGDPTKWVEHYPAGGTFHHTAAFWRRILPNEKIATRITIPKSQRFQASTLGLWYSDLLEVFNPAGGKP